MLMMSRTLSVETSSALEQSIRLTLYLALHDHHCQQLLTTIVNVIEEANCAAFRSAAVDNAWADAFERLYASINDEFVRPTGKNRIHKFKSKVCKWTSSCTISTVR